MNQKYDYTISILRRRLHLPKAVLQYLSVFVAYVRLVYCSPDYAFR